MFSPKQQHTSQVSSLSYKSRLERAKERTTDDDDDERTSSVCVLYTTTTLKRCEEIILLRTQFYYYYRCFFFILFFFFLVSIISKNNEIKMEKKTSMKTLNRDLRKKKHTHEETQTFEKYFLVRVWSQGETFLNNTTQQQHKKFLYDSHSYYTLSLSLSLHHSLLLSPHQSAFVLRSKTR